MAVENAGEKSFLKTFLGLNKKVFFASGRKWEMKMKNKKILKFFEFFQKIAKNVLQKFFIGLSKLKIPSKYVLFRQMLVFSHRVDFVKESIPRVKWCFRTL